MIIIRALIISLFLSVNAYAATYYVDYDGGADTKNGTAKETPWKRAPGMNGCADNCAAYSHSAGDTFIFKGGVTWPSACYNDTDGWWITEDGTSGSEDTYTVDATWYSGGSWSQPVFDAQGTYKNVITVGGDYIILDNLEITGVNGAAYGDHNLIIDGDHVTVQNCYIHGHVYGIGSGDHKFGGIGIHGGDYVTIDGCTIEGDSVGASNPYDNGCGITVNDNFDGGGVASYIEIKNSTIHGWPNGLVVSDAQEFSLRDNEIYDINLSTDFPTTHCNAMVGTAGDVDIEDVDIYNNYIHDIDTNQGIYIGVGTNTDRKITRLNYYNNVIVSSTTTKALMVDNCNTVNVFNNTVITGDAVAFYALNSGQTITNLTVYNNHFETAGSGVMSIGATRANLLVDYNNYIGSDGEGGDVWESETLVERRAATTFDDNSINLVSTGWFDASYNLLVGSNLIDAGTDGVSGVLTVGKGGVRRPAGSAYDIGAYEYTTSVPSGTGVFTVPKTDSSGHLSFSPKTSGGHLSITIQ